MTKDLKPVKKLPTTFRQVFGAPMGNVSSNDIPSWRITGSGVSDRPTRARNTKRIVNLLKEHGVSVEEAYSPGMVGADSHFLNATFLDGGLSAMTGNYIGGAKGASITGAKAVLFVALGLRLKVPPEFFTVHGLLNTTSFDDLLHEA